MEQKKLDLGSFSILFFFLFRNSLVLKLLRRFKCKKKLPPWDRNVKKLPPRFRNAKELPHRDRNVNNCPAGLGHKVSRGCGKIKLKILLFLYKKKNAKIILLQNI